MAGKAQTLVGGGEHLVEVDLLHVGLKGQLALSARLGPGSELGQAVYGQVLLLGLAHGLPLFIDGRAQVAIAGQPRSSPADGTLHLFDLRLLPSKLRPELIERELWHPIDALRKHLGCALLLLQVALRLLRCGASPHQLGL